jgi:hypothetical protein
MSPPVLRAPYPLAKFQLLAVNDFHSVLARFLSVSMVGRIVGCHQNQSKKQQRTEYGICSI